MDNNLNNNFGIPGTNNIDTPAESFDNLYGNNTGTQVNNQQVGVSMTQTPQQQNSNSEVVNNVAQNNTAVAQNMGTEQITPIMGANNQNITSQVTPNNLGQTANPMEMANNINTQAMPNPVQPQSNPTMEQPSPQPVFETPIQSTTPIQPEPNVVNPINTAEPMQTINNPAPTINPGVIMTPTQNTSNPDLSSIDIDSERMQSIEEQLSKTSQYNPEDLQQEKITIPTDNQDEKNKSGLVFVIVLFAILALVIAFLPQITKWIS